MRLWQLYVATVLAAVLAVYGVIWFGEVVRLAFYSNDHRYSCAARSPTGDPNDPICSSRK